MFEHKGHFLGDRIGVNRHRHRSKALCGGNRPIKMRPIGADDRYLVSLCGAEFGETRCQAAYDRIGLRPVPGLPDAEILVAHRNAGAARPGVELEKLGKRIVRCLTKLRQTLPSRSRRPHLAEAAGLIADAASSVKSGASLSTLQTCRRKASGSCRSLGCIVLLFLMTSIPPEIDFRSSSI